MLAESIVPSLQGLQSSSMVDTAHGVSQFWPFILAGFPRQELSKLIKMELRRKWWLVFQSISAWIHYEKYNNIIHLRKVALFLPFWCFFANASVATWCFLYTSQQDLIMHKMFSSSRQLQSMYFKCMYGITVGELQVEKLSHGKWKQLAQNHAVAELEIDFQSWMPSV